MRPWIIVLHVLPALALLVPCGGARAQAPPTAVDSTSTAVDRIFARWDHTDSPGCALGVSQNGTPMYTRGYGMANLEYDLAISPASVFHLASVSKQFTALAVLLLARDGKLSLDDDVRRYIPELPEYGHRITLRHLLTHTSGLRDQWALIGLARGRFEEDLITEGDVLDVVTRQRAVNFAPGAEWLYSNTGYTLAAVIVRRVSGQSLHDFADARIFAPLGMRHTHFHDDHAMIVKNRTSAYTPGTGGAWKVSVPLYDTYGATSLFSTVSDLLTWEENYEHPRVGDAELLGAMQTSAVLTNGASTGYGLGLQAETYRRARLVGHSGADAGYRTYIGRFPDHHLAVVILCNLSAINPAALAKQVADVYLAGSLGPALPDSGVATLSPEQLAQFAGVYVDTANGQVLRFAVQGDHLTVGGATGIAYFPQDEQHFRNAALQFEAIFTVAAAGATRLTLSRPGRPTDRFERPAPASLRPGGLAPYVGTYYSSELDATYVVHATDSTLVLRTRMGEGLTVRPAFADTFEGTTAIGGVVLRFTRDPRGAISGALLSNSRARNVRFTRVPSEQRRPMTASNTP